MQVDIIVLNKSIILHYLSVPEYPTGEHLENLQIFGYTIVKIPEHII